MAELEKRKRGEKTWNGRTYSRKEWRQAFATTAVCLPVVKPLDGEWSEFRRALDASLEDVRLIANTVVNQCLRQEPTAEDGEKLPPFTGPGKDAYQVVTARFPEMATGSVAAVMQDAQLRYKEKRFDALRTGRDTFPTFRQGRAPLPIRAQDYDLSFDSEDRPQVSFRLGSRKADGRRWTVALKTGRDFRRQLDILRRVLGGEGRLGYLYLHLKPCANGCRDATLLHYRDRFGRRIPHVLMAKIVVSVPRVQRAGLEGTLYVRTLPDSLLGLSTKDDGSVAWRLHADNLRAQVFRHKELIQRLSDDKKLEQRHRRNRIDRNMRDLCDKNDRRVDTQIKQIARMVGNYAVRRRVARIVIDDSCREFLPSFDYFKLWSRLEQVAGETGIVVEKGEPRKEASA